MLYIVRSGDNMFRIAQRHRTTIPALMKANLICNPRITISGDILQIPRPGAQAPRLGAGPYYVFLPGDSLECIAHYTDTSIAHLVRNNGINNPRRLCPGMELLILGSRPDSEELFDAWNSRPANDQLSEEQRRQYYQETFAWQALGKKAISPLRGLLAHPCPEVRYYAILSLGRLGMDQETAEALESCREDRYRENHKLARLAIDRIILSRQGYRRTRFLIKSDRLIDDLNRLSPAVTALTAGTGVMVLKWHIPAPEEDEPALYDYVLVVASGQKGFLRRRHGQLNLI